MYYFVIPSVITISVWKLCVINTDIFWKKNPYAFLIVLISIDLYVNSSYSISAHNETLGWRGY